MLNILPAFRLFQNISYNCLFLNENVSRTLKNLFFSYPFRKDSKWNPVYQDRKNVEFINLCFDFNQLTYDNKLIQYDILTTQTSLCQSYNLTVTNLYRFKNRRCLSKQELKVIIVYFYFQTSYDFSEIVNYISSTYTIGKISLIKLSISFI